MIIPDFFFARVDSDETTFDPVAHRRRDFDVFEAKLNGEEGQFDKLVIQIRNPYVGIIAPGEKIWVWWSWLNPETGHVEPLFFGRIKGVPTSLLAETCSIQLSAEPLDYPIRKQVVAETLKVRPYYDPVWLAPDRRDDPDAILEGYSALYQTDRITHEVTLNDILAGDSIEVFQSGLEVPFDSVDVTIAQPPLMAINVDGTITWTQQATGVVDLGRKTFISYTGASIISDWPKPEASFGGGWSVFASSALDYYNISTAINISLSAQFQNRSHTHTNGDIMNWQWSWNGPMLGCPTIKNMITWDILIGICDPWDEDFQDEPNSHANYTFQYVPLWRVDTTLILRYDAARPRSEHIRFTLTANLQAVITPNQSPPLPAQETLTLSGVDVGQPLANVLDWNSVRGLAVGFGQVIFPNQPTIPGGTSFQICTTPGVCGAIEPRFSPVVGAQTIDGSVVWTSLGPSLGVSTPDRAFSTEVPVGAIIRPRRPITAPWDMLVPPPRVTGTSMSIGQYCSDAGSYFICTLPGTTEAFKPNFNRAYGATTVDGTMVWTCVGSYLPNNDIYYLCVQSGVTDPNIPPPYNPTLGATFGDGGVIWKSLGVAGGFIQLPIVDLARRSYFPTDRGLWSVEHLICKARAKLLLRSRCVQTTWECPFERAVNLSCRKNAQLFDRRLPGGSVLGKITKYEIFANGDQKFMRGSVTISSSVGHGNTVASQAGTPTYVTGYVNGYRKSINDQIALPGGDVGYSTPIEGVDDDGLVFPLDRGQILVRDAVWGRVGGGLGLEAQLKAIERGRLLAIELAVLQAQSQSPTAPAWYRIQKQQEIAVKSRESTESFLARVPIWQDYEIKPVQNGPFNAEYQLITTMLEAPKQYDAEAAAS